MVGEKMIEYTIAGSIAGPAIDLMWRKMSL